MKAGRNTPQTVLGFIAAVEAKMEPPECLGLARELGIGSGHYRRMKAKYGDDLQAHLLKIKHARREHPQFLARQNGRYHPQQYVSSAQGAIDDLETVPANYHNVLVVEARERFERHRQESESEELARRDFRAVSATIKQTAVEMARAGADPVPFLTEIQQVVNKHRRDAA